MIVSKMAPEELPRPQQVVPSIQNKNPCRKQKRSKNVGVLQERNIFTSLIESTFRFYNLLGINHPTIGWFLWHSAFVGSVLKKRYILGPLPLCGASFSWSADRLVCDNAKFLRLKIPPPQGGPVPVINGVVIPINGLIDGVTGAKKPDSWDYSTATSQVAPSQEETSSFSLREGNYLYYFLCRKKTWKATKYWLKQFIRFYVLLFVSHSVS